MRKNCPNCGEPINVDYKFCQNCGMNLERFKDEMQATPRQKKSEPADNPPAPAKVIEQNFPPNVYVPDRGLWQKFFTVKGRLNPMRFIFRITLVYFATFILGLLLALLPLPVDVKNTLFLGLIYTPVITMIPLAIRRAHDFGRPWWYCFIGAIPILAGVFELIFQKVWYHDRYGDYHESYRVNDAGVIFSFLYVIVAGILAVVYFTFRSGDKGRNEYGADPTGKNQADIPFEENHFLAAISKAEESKYSALIIVGVIATLCFGTSVIGDLMKKNSSPGVQQSIVATNQNVTAPVVPVQNNSAPPVKVESPKNPESELLAKPLTGENQKQAVETLVSFHRNITQKQYRNAYNLLSYDFQYEMNYDGWAAGFNTTVSSSVSQISVVSESHEEISLNYILTAVDNIQGREEITKFNGTVRLINENGSWKIDYIKNKFL